MSPWAPYYQQHIQINEINSLIRVWGIRISCFRFLKEVEEGRGGEDSPVWLGSGFLRDSMTSDRLIPKNPPTPRLESWGFVPRTRRGIFWKDFRGSNFCPRLFLLLGRKRRILPADCFPIPVSLAISLPVPSSLSLPVPLLIPTQFSSHWLSFHLFISLNIFWYFLLSHSDQ